MQTELWIELGKCALIVSLPFPLLGTVVANMIIGHYFALPYSGPPDVASFADGTDDKRFAKFRAIDKDGICLVGEPLDSGTIMVNKGN